ncbi:hypothetical protein EI94DRAFT_1818695 [Lactarius quietus]|nr:hypothetical protein EI94DRAFT_1818695 [Lactarius quietus]
MSRLPGPLSSRTQQIGLGVRLADLRNEREEVLGVFARLSGVSVALQATIAPLGPGTFSHNPAGILITTKGTEVERQRVSLHRMLHSFIILMGWANFRKYRLLLHDSAADDNRQQAEHSYIVVPTGQGLIRPSSHPSTTRRPDKEFLAENYDENARHANHNLSGIFRTDVSAPPAAGVVKLLSFPMRKVKCALAEIEVSSKDATLDSEAHRYMAKDVGL